MQLVNSGCLNMFNHIQKSWLKSSFLESLASLDWLLYPTENELSGSRNSEWNIFKSACEIIALQHEKYHLSQVEQDLKIQWEIHFWTFLFVHQNCSNFFFRLEIWTFGFQNRFQNWFLTSSKFILQQITIISKVYFFF